jgi:hypothetical protein
MAIKLDENQMIVALKKALALISPQKVNNVYRT